MQATSTSTSGFFLFLSLPGPPLQSRTMRRGFLLSPANPKPSSSSSPKPPSSSQNPDHLKTQNPSHLETLNPRPSSSSRNLENQPDRLSSLPDPILHQIISLLPTDEMVRTSILSSHYLRQWTHAPRLHLIRNFSNFIKWEDHHSIVDLCLSRCSGSPSASLSLAFPLAQDPDFSTHTLTRWIDFATAHSVQELTLAPVLPGYFFVELPPSLFDCRRLTVLKLVCCRIPTVPSGSGFPSLRIIVLTNVMIEDGPLKDLLSCCPRIEAVSISIVRSLKRVVIRAQSIKHFMVYDCVGLEVVDIAEAPELRRLMYAGDLERLRVGAVLEKIEEVALLSMTESPFVNDFEGWRRLAAAVACARVLCVNNWIFEVPTYRYFGSGDEPIIFKNAKELHWWPVYKVSPGDSGWRAKRLSTVSLCGLLSLLWGCPCLEHLCIRGTYYMEVAENGMLEPDDSQDDGSSYHGEERVSEFDDEGCELSCLKKVRMIEFAGRKREILLLAYLANKAASLETISLHYVEEKEEELEDIRRKLNRIQHASPYVDVSFQEFDVDEACPKHESMFFEHMMVV